MQRNVLRAVLLAMVALLLSALPAVAQSEDDGVFLSNETGSVLVGMQNDVMLAAGEEADFIFVADGNAQIEGTANTIVALESDVVISGSAANVDGVFIVGGSLDVGNGATVENISHTDTDVTIDATAVVDEDNVNDIREEFAGALAWIVAGIALVALFIFVGWFLAVLFSALLAVAFGTSQLRRAAFNIGNDVLKTIFAGVLMIVLPWAAIILLAITVVGIPLAIGLALMWMFVAFLGYLTFGLWIGERILSRSRTAERPYGAAFLGTLILILLSFIPVLNIVTTIGAFLGLGAVGLAGWRVLRGGGVPPVPPGYGQQYGQPMQVAPPPYAPPPYAPPPPGQWPPQGGPPSGWPQG